MPKTHFFDIETGPATDRSLFRPEFEPARNLKDPEKIKDDLARKEREWDEGAALSALTGEILAIGWQIDDKFGLIEGPEKTILEQFWQSVDEALGRGESIVGFYCMSFDWPFAVRRAHRHGVNVPMSVRRRRYWSDQLYDVADTWLCGSHDPRDRISLDNLAKFLGVGAKTGDGADFAELWVKDKPAAIAYLQNDVELIRRIFHRTMPTL